MSLQTDLYQAVAQVTADSALLHTIVHGTAAQTVTTEGGAVATVAKLLADADARINLAADGLLAQRKGLRLAVAHHPGATFLEDHIPIPIAQVGRVEAAPPVAQRRYIQVHSCTSRAF